MTALDTLKKILAFPGKNRTCEYCLIISLSSLLCVTILAFGHFGNWGVAMICMVVGSSLIISATLNPHTNQMRATIEWAPTQSTERLFLESLAEI